MALASTTPTDDETHLALLYKVSHSLGSSLDLSEVLNQVMDAIIQLTGAERGFLMLMDWETGRLRLRAGRNVDKETIEGKAMEISRTVVRRVVKHGEPVVTSNAQEDPRFADQSSVIGFSLRSIMCAPLRARGKIVGAVYVDNRIHSSIFSESDLGMLAAFANQAAMAIENARLFTLTDQKLNDRVEELSVMQRIDRELNTSLDFNQVMDLALEWAVNLVEADSGLISLLNEEAGLAEVIASKGSDSASEQIPLDHPILAQVIESGETVLTHSPGETQSMDGTPAAVQVAVPVMREGHVIAVISLESNRAAAFDQDSVDFLGRMADRAAIAIENARLYNAVRAANEAKSAFVSVVSHELRIPMTSIKGYTDMLKSGAVGPVNDMQGEFLNTIRRNVDRMTVLVSDLSDINRMESGRLALTFAKVDLREVVDEVLAGLKVSFDDRQQPVTINLPEGLPAVWADRSRVIQIVTNLMSNANKYSPDGRPVVVGARVLADGEKSLVQVAVADRGLGISPEDQALLFTQFFRSEDPAVREQTGWGLGLSIVKMLVEALGGAVSVESEVGVGSTFAFILPVANES